MFKNFLLENYNATDCEIAMQGSSNSVDFKLLKSTINLEPILGPQKKSSKFKKEIAYAIKLNVTFCSISFKSRNIFFLIPKMCQTIMTEISRCMHVHKSKCKI